MIPVLYSSTQLASGWSLPLLQYQIINFTSLNDNTKIIYFGFWLKKDLLKMGTEKKKLEVILKVTLNTAS